MTQSAPEAQVAAAWVPDDSTFGARLALIRQRMGWNITEAARECGLTPESWRLWEQTAREPRLFVTIAMTIASRTGADLDWLVYGPSRAQLQARADHSTRYGARNIPEIGTGVGERVLTRRIPRQTALRNRVVDRPLPTRAVAATRPTAQAKRPVTRVAVA